MLEVELRGGRGNWVGALGLLLRRRLVLILIVVLVLTLLLRLLLVLLLVPGVAVLLVVFTASAASASTTVTASTSTIATSSSIVAAASATSTATTIAAVSASVQRAGGRRRGLRKELVEICRALQRYIWLIGNNRSRTAGRPLFLVLVFRSRRAGVLVPLRVSPSLLLSALVIHLLLVVRKFDITFADSTDSFGRVKAVILAKSS